MTMAPVVRVQFSQSGRKRFRLNLGKIRLSQTRTSIKSQNGNMAIEYLEIIFITLNFLYDLFVT